MLVFIGGGIVGRVESVVAWTTTTLCVDMAASDGRGDDEETPGWRRERKEAWIGVCDEEYACGE